MDLNAILAPIVEFFSTDLGQFIGRFLTAIYEFLYPANSEAPHEVPIPE